MADEKTLSAMELDAIGEVMNISMGSAATAVSTMLDRQTVITTPTVEIHRMADVDYTELEPAMMVKIIYVEGVSGSNVMVFKQSDMQLILNQLMGIDEPPSDDFVFDELSMSAACEVMNQMMGASSTAMSDFLNKRVDISPPTATVMDEENTFKGALGLPEEQTVVRITFNLEIVGITNSQFISVMTVDLAKEIVSQFLGGDDTLVIPDTPAPEPIPEPPVGQAQPVYPLEHQQSGYMPPVPSSEPAPIAAPPPTAPRVTAPPPPQNIHPAQFPTFDAPYSMEVPSGNINLLMNVPLTVTVEIGRATRKIKDITEFAHGTVIELEKQAGAPVDIMVNGQLMARGDVVVIDDNFGVRVTEILNVQNVLDNLNK